MIRLFNRNETDFTHNETVLNEVLSTTVEEEANGLYEAILEYPRNDFAKILTEGKIIKVPTARGEQLFRIYKPIKDLTSHKIYARHIFYDLLTNFIEAIKPTGKSGTGAIADILGASQINQGFTGTSDISSLGTAYYVRMNPVQALIGAPNSFLKVWGGELIRDNFTFKINAKGGQDRGYEVRLGKNLLGVEVETDESNVFTRIYPTVVIDGNTVTTLPEKYIDSPLINSYEYPKIIEERMDLTDDEKEYPIEIIYKMMRDRCIELFDSGVDKPQVNFKVDFIELSKTEQYKHLKLLEKLDLYDTVKVYIPELDINLSTKVIKTEYDSLSERYKKMELGSFKPNAGSQQQNTINRIDKEINQAVSGLQQAFDKAQDMITGNLGGHIIHRLNAEGKPYEMLVMDTEDLQTAKNVIRLNQQGIGFSQNGYNGPFGIAMTIDGHIVADFIDVGTLKASLIQAGFNDISDRINIEGSSLAFLNADSSEITELKNGRINFKSGNSTHIWKAMKEGIALIPGSGNTGNDNNSGLWLQSTYYNYLDFGYGSDGGYGVRVAKRDDWWEVLSKNGGDFRLVHGPDPATDRKWLFQDGKYGSFSFGKTRLTFNGEDDSTYPRVSVLNANTNEYAFISAASFDISSERELKDDIRPLEGALGILSRVNVYQYTKNEQEEVGIITDEAPEQLLTDGGTKVSIYSYVATLHQAVKELSETVAQQEMKMDKLTRLLTEKGVI